MPAEANESLGCLGPYIPDRWSFNHVLPQLAGTIEIGVEQSDTAMGDHRTPSLSRRRRIPQASAELSDVKNRLAAGGAQSRSEQHSPFWMSAQVYPHNQPSVASAHRHWPAGDPRLRRDNALSRR